jgi:hypothetical protein
MSHNIIVSKELDAQVVQSTEDGKTIPQICNETGLSSRKVIDIRKEYGLDKNKWWENRTPKQPKPETLLEELSQVTNTLVERHMKLKATNDKLEPDFHEVCLKLLDLIEKVKKK